MKEKKIPERRCVGCGISFPKKDLIRVVRLPDGGAELDPTGKKSGRGAYICRSAECLKKARKAKRLERNLEVTISDEVYEELERGLSEK
ncbi:MAG: YlxR family protein [Eubacteriales bacterium]|nr:YlxR family protein [Candidatus Colimorpha enterica]